MIYGESKSHLLSVLRGISFCITFIPYHHFEHITIIILVGGLESAC